MEFSSQSYSIPIDEIKRHDDLPMHLVSLREQFKDTYGLRFDSGFQRCMSKLQERIKEIKLSFHKFECSPEISNCAGSLRIQWGKDNISYNVSKYTLGKVSLKTADVFQDKIEIKIQKKMPSEKIWVCIGTVSVPIINLCTDNLQEIMIRCCENPDKVICKLRIQGADLEKHSTCKVSNNILTEQKGTPFK